MSKIAARTGQEARATKTEPDDEIDAPAPAAGAQRRWSIYMLLIVIAGSLMVGRVLSVSARHGRTPFLSANDRSRIATVRSLVDHGTYAIDNIIYQTHSGRVVRDAAGLPVPIRDWHSIDMVRHVDSTGELRSYSSKPTLLATLIAGEYWLVKKSTGATLKAQPFYVGRVLLLITNVIPLIGTLLLLGVLIERFGRSDWGRIFVMATACFGTFVTTFAVTINNHTPAAISATLTLLALVKIWLDDDRRWFWFALAGFGAAFTAANELPALAFLAIVAAALAWRDWFKTLVAFAPPALVVAAVALGTNYIAHGSWKTPYAHRGDGPALEKTLPATAAAELDQGQVPASLRDALAAAPVKASLTNEAKIIIKQPGQRWVLSDRDEALRYAIVRVGEKLEVRGWDRWYEFAGSYWRGNEQGIDRGERSALAYAFHCTFGHHGIFSLTPVWLLALAGTFWFLIRRQESLFPLAVLVLVTTSVVLAFYLSRPQLDRTYGGFTSGLRWMFWFTPLWLMMMLPVADWLGRTRWGRAVALVLLAISAMSAIYASGNPWTHPWLYDYWVHLGWIATG